MNTAEYEFDPFDLYTVSQKTYSLLLKWGVPHSIAIYVNLILHLLILILLVYILQYLVRRLLRVALIRIAKRSRISFFQHLLENRFPHFLALSAPLILVKKAIPIIFSPFPALIPSLTALADIYMVVIIIWMIMSLLRSGADSLQKKTAFRAKPIESYLQVIRIILFLIGAVVIFSNLTGQSPIAFFTAMGAISAVLLLMFKDTIMGFVASIQVSTNDIVRIGDWITMTKYGADGDVTEINLTTVKVQNFDKTITTIPTYALISDSFQNWRGMQQAGGRRIKRAIYIKQSTIRFVTDQELENFKRIQAIAPYIDHRKKDIDKSNERSGADKSLLINGRNLTNAGLYRKYIDNYISSHSGIHKKMTMMVRHLAPTANGLPLEIYAFTSTTKWADYEYIMADIFDHLLAAAIYFDLQIYEMEGSGDTKTLHFGNSLSLQQ
ncbi:mechanosensitive ion channel family protein [Pedobacter nutrimenti]|jgi:miniconductance mechanosensitive channel|uniref:Mechanosensing system component YbdG n=1 Tax=Pedobacter nutrimenti TaxID=1241337 RepID=A0A318UMR3_9SPHI|nr:mechanosensitive ion channel domain-containing protein [Pedobacter nutrimenti]PYF70798.1 miniconductance mechanosensitive channel [Pedobacter nutrimenti]